MSDELGLIVQALAAREAAREAESKASAEDMLEEDRRGWAERLVVIAAQVLLLEDELEELRGLLRDGPSLREAFAAQGRLVEIGQAKLALEEELRAMLAAFGNRPDVDDLDEELRELGERLQAMASPLVLLAHRFEDIVTA